MDGWRQKKANLTASTLLDDLLGLATDYLTPALLLPSYCLT